MDVLKRTISFAAFNLVEYLRSGRFLVEGIAVLAGYYFLFRPTNPPMIAERFFSNAGLCTALLMFYTTTSMMGLGDRPEGYVVLARRIGRGGYLAGLYLAALSVGLACYGAFALTTALLNPAQDLSFGGWLLGTLPLGLNIALVGALLTLLSPMVLTAGWRLFILALAAIAFSGGLIGGSTQRDLWAPITTATNVLRTIFGTPLLPAFSGYTLSVTRNYSGFYAAIPFAQLSLTLSLLALSLYAFGRRELRFIRA